MRLIDSPWLTDENIHPEVSLYLRSRGLDVQDVKEQRWHGRSDEDLIDEAYRSGRIILTHDGVSEPWLCFVTDRCSASFEFDPAISEPR